MKRSQSGHALLIIIIVVISLAILGLLGFLFWQNFINKAGSASAVTNFEQCKAAKGSKLLETYPEQCVTQDGQTFVGPSKAGDDTSFKTYCSVAEKLCFDYPSTWKVEAFEGINEPGGSTDNVKVTAPDGKFSLRLASGVSGLGGACPEEVQKDVTILSSVAVLGLSGFEDPYHQNMAAVARVIYQNEDDHYVAAVYVTASKDYVKAGNIKGCGTGFSEYNVGKNSVISPDYPGAGVFRFGNTGSGYYEENTTWYRSLDEAKAAYETDNYKQAVALLATLRYE